MFERFTDSCRKAVTLSNREALRYNHEYIGPEHILLGLASVNKGFGFQILHGCSIDIDKLRNEIENLIKTGSNTISQGKVPQSPQAKKVVEMAINEARSLDHCEIGTEHLLLGLLKIEDSIASQVLTALGITYKNAREMLVDLHDKNDTSEENQNSQVPQEADIHSIQLFENEDSFTKCPQCEYNGGFHILFYGLKNKQHSKWILVCPGCKSKFNVGLNSLFRG